MRFDNPAHRFSGGVDGHARTMDLCLVDHAGPIVWHHEVPAEPAAFLEAIAPDRDGLVVAGACLFCWYGLAERCQAEHLAVVLGQALSRKAIHGGKSKDDTSDSPTIAPRWRGGQLPSSTARVPG